MAWSDGEIDIQRDYFLFSALAGVRADQPPLIAPRGIPQDVSTNVFEHYYNIIVEPSDLEMYSDFQAVTPDTAEHWLRNGSSHRSPEGHVHHTMRSKLGYVSEPDAHTPS